MTNKLNYFSVEGATYGYRVTGEGEPLILLHGFTGSMLTWKYMVKQWRHQFQIITIDLPGHGKTHIKNPKSMKDFCDDLIKLFDYLKIKSAHIVGYSMGGRIALSFYNYYPEAVASLVLESASPGLKTDDERQDRIKKDAKVAEKIKTDFTEFVNFWESIPLFTSHEHLSDEAKRDLRDERLMQTPQGLIDSLTHMGTGVQPSWWKSLVEITVPVLLITGVLDDKFVKINTEMAKMIPKNRLEVISDSGHTPHIEQREMFDKLVITFINEIKNIS